MCHRRPSVDIYMSAHCHHCRCPSFDDPTGFGHLGTTQLSRAGKPVFQTNRSRVLAGGSGSTLAQRLHLLKTLGGIPHDRRDPKDPARLIVEWRDRELDRDA
jgi:hypothetical protein